MNESDDELARTLDRVLQDLPLRRAPAALEARVFGELQRRAALPWWRRSFAHWPLPARAAFLVICAALIRLALLEAAVAVAGVRSLHQSGALSLSWAHGAGVLAATASNLVMLLARAVPPGWAYAGIAACTLLYAALFGLGAVVYRMLYFQPYNGR
jgi:hypothetical protein